MRVGLVIGLVVLVGCAGEAEEVDDSRSPAPGVTGGEAGAPTVSAATGGGAPAPASGGSLPADPTGGSPAASGGNVSGALGAAAGAVGSGGAVGTGGEEAASGGVVTGAMGGTEEGGGEGGAEGPATGGASATGGAETGGEATGGESSGGTDTGGVGPRTGGSTTGGAEPAACTYTCTTTTTDADGATSASTTRNTYDPCVAGLAESSRCTQTESVAIATVCSIDREPEPIECEPLSPTGGGGAGGAAPEEPAHGKWILDGTCVRLVAGACPSEGLLREMCTTDEHRSLALNTEISEVRECDDGRLNCDGRDWLPGLQYQDPGPGDLAPPVVMQVGCELSTGDSDPPSCSEVLDDRETWDLCVWGVWGVNHFGEPCESSTCYACVPVCVN